MGEIWKGILNRICDFTAQVSSVTVMSHSNTGMDPALTLT